MTSDASAPRRNRGIVSGFLAGYTSWQFALACIFFFGAILRIHGLGWDQPSGSATPLQMHPDERFLSFVLNDTEWPGSVGGYFDTANSPLNPYNAPSVNAYVYGTAPLFAVKGIDTAYRNLPGSLKSGLEKVGISGPGGESKYDTGVVWGRRLTVLTDTLTILLVFGLGSFLFNRGVGLMGAFLYACAVLPTQLAHFFAMDPYVTFFATATMLASARAIVANGRREQTILVVILGLTVGLGLASKVTAWPLVVIPTAAFCVRAAIRELPALDLRWRGVRRVTEGHWTGDLAMLSMVGAITIFIFRVMQPYAFEGPSFFNMGLNPEWVTDMKREIDFQNGNVDFPPFIQFANRTPFLWPLQNMVLWGLGPALAITGWLAAAVGGVLLFKRRELVYLLPLILIVSIMGFQGPRFVAWLRYFAPMYPVLCLFAAWAIVSIVVAARRGQGVFEGDRLDRRLSGVGSFSLEMPAVRTVAVGACFMVILATTFWAVAFQSIYFREHTRVEASRWIYENVEQGSHITSELWDDSLPYPLAEGHPAEVVHVETEPFRPDTPEKIRDLIYGFSIENRVNVGLDGADYVVVSSYRVKGAIRQLPGEYPATILYYESLDSGALGFDLVAHFESRPSFLGITIDDSGADESFTVYDHPEVSIYKKSDRWDPEAAEALLMSAHPERAQNLLPRQGRTNGLQFLPEKAAIQQAGGTFRDAFYGGLGANVPWLWWILWLEVAAFAAVPWVTWLFRRLPDRGFGLSKIIGFGGVGLVAWLVVAWDFVHFSGALAWVVLVAWVLAGGAVAYYRRDALREDVREKWRTWLAAEAVFLVVFTFFLLLRAFNPDTWHHPQGGEKPMELAYMTAVAKSTILPPYDPWFGGGTMNYYYMGWWLLAVPIRALRILPEIAFNLAIPTYAAIGATTAFSTVSNLVGLSQRARRRVADAPHPPARVMIITGIVGAILLIGIGNLDGMHQTVERFQQLNVASLDAAGRPATYHWGFASDIPIVGGAVGFFSGVYRYIFEGEALRGFDWWRSSRVHLGTFDITEFPFWSLLFADLHPHLMGLPFFGLLIAFGLAYVRNAMEGDRARSWIFAGLLGLSLGLIRTIHTWDFPTATLLVGSSVLVGQLLAPGRWQTRWWFLVAHLALAAGLLTIAFQPYTQNFEVFNSGIMKAPETTKPNQYFAHFGLFVVSMLAFLAVRYHEILRARDFRPGRNPVLAVVAGRWEVLALWVFLIGLAAFTWRLDVTTVALSAILLLFLFNLLWLEWTSADRDLGRIFATAFFTVAVGIAAGTDVVVVKNDIVRMNTVFKFLLQAWQLYALASAYAAWYVGAALWHWEGWSARPIPGRRFLAIGGAATAAGFLFASAIFTWSGTSARQNARFVETGPTLNGFAFFPGSGLFDDLGTQDPADDIEIKLADDKPLIDWLRVNVDGSPIIAEAVGGLYHWTGRMSWNTGLPAVIGWDWHQTQQRWDYSGEISRRRLDTERFYDDPNTAFARDYISRYQVKYVVVGMMEYAYGTTPGVEKFATMDGLTEVFRSGKYAIYRVD